MSTNVPFKVVVHPTSVESVADPTRDTPNAGSKSSRISKISYLQGTKERAEKAKKQTEEGKRRRKPDGMEAAEMEDAEFRMFGRTYRLPPSKEKEEIKERERRRKAAQELNELVKRRRATENNVAGKNNTGEREEVVRSEHAAVLIQKTDIEVIEISDDEDVERIARAASERMGDLESHLSLEENEEESRFALTTHKAEEEIPPAPEQEVSDVAGTPAPFPSLAERLRMYSLVPATPSPRGCRKCRNHELDVPPLPRAISCPRFSCDCPKCFAVDEFNRSLREKRFARKSATTTDAPVQVSEATEPQAESMPSPVSRIDMDNSRQIEDDVKSQDDGSEEMEMGDAGSLHRTTCDKPSSTVPISTVGEKSVLCRTNSTVVDAMAVTTEARGEVIVPLTGLAELISLPPTPCPSVYDLSDPNTHPNPPVNGPWALGKAGGPVVTPDGTTVFPIRFGIEQAFVRLQDVKDFLRRLARG